MARKIVRIPITNVFAGGDYTGKLRIGSDPKELNVLLDTGSSTLAVHQTAYDPTEDAEARATDVAQEVVYGSGAWLGAVVQTSVTVGADTAGSAPVALRDVAVAVATEVRDMFRGFDGILGLAYDKLDNAFEMPRQTWPMDLTPQEIQSGRRVLIDPYFSQLEQAGIVADKFAFYTRRSFKRCTLDDPAADPLNQGWLILGGGEEATDLYSGSFQSVRVVRDAWYNIDLKQVIVDGCAPIPVHRATRGSPIASNAILDSGTNSMTLDRQLYGAMMKAFQGLNPELQQAVNSTEVSTQGFDLKRWPDIHFVLEGDGGDVKLTLPPDCYWQLDAGQRGTAIAPIFSDNGTLRGQSILGLPLMNNYFTVHDRSTNGGRGFIKFAPIKRT